MPALEAAQHEEVADPQGAIWRDRDGTLDVVIVRDRKFRWVIIKMSTERPLDIDDRSPGL